MIQPISGPPPGQPPGQGDNLPSGAGNQPLSSQQRTSLESLMTKVTSLTQQQRAELWAGIRHDIGLSGDSPLLSRHFPAAEHNLAQRLLAAQKSHSARQLLAQLGSIYVWGIIVRRSRIISVITLVRRRLISSHRSN